MCTIYKNLHDDQATTWLSTTEKDEWENPLLQHQLNNDKFHYNLMLAN